MLFSKTAFIEFMMEANVLSFGDFITKSGRKTPYFVNTGKYDTGAKLQKLGKFYADFIYETIGEQFEAFFGPAYKGIPLATSVACAFAQYHQIDKPFFFNRKEEKDHGEGGSIVGYKPQKKDRIIIIEDVITAGTAIRETMPILQNLGNITVPHMFISVNRCEQGSDSSQTAVQEVQENFGISVHALVDIQDIYEYLQTHSDYQEWIPKMKAYMNTYCLF